MSQEFGQRLRLKAKQVRRHADGLAMAGVIALTPGKELQAHANQSRPLQDNVGRNAHYDGNTSHSTETSQHDSQKKNNGKNATSHKKERGYTKISTKQKYAPQVEGDFHAHSHSSTHSKEHAGKNVNAGNESFQGNAFSVEAQKRAEKKHAQNEAIAQIGVAQETVVTAVQVLTSTRGSEAYWLTDAVGMLTETPAHVHARDTQVFDGLKQGAQEAVAQAMTVEAARLAREIGDNGQLAKEVVHMKGDALAKVGIDISGVGKAELRRVQKVAPELVKAMDTSDSPEEFLQQTKDITPVNGFGSLGLAGMGLSTAILAYGATKKKDWAVQLGLAGNVLFGGATGCTVTHDTTEPAVIIVEESGGANVEPTATATALPTAAPTMAPTIETMPTVTPTEAPRGRTLSTLEIDILRDELKIVDAQTLDQITHAQHNALKMGVALWGNYSEQGLNMDTELRDFGPSNVIIPSRSDAILITPKEEYPDTFFNTENMYIFQVDNLDVGDGGAAVTGTFYVWTGEGDEDIYAQTQGEMLQNVRAYIPQGRFEWGEYAGIWTVMDVDNNGNVMRYAGNDGNWVVLNADGTPGEVVAVPTPTVETVKPFEPINPVSNPEVFNDEILPNLQSIDFEAGGHEVKFGIYNPTGRETWGFVEDALPNWGSDLDLPFNETTHGDATKREVIGNYLNLILEAGHDGDRFTFQTVRAGNDSSATINGIKEISEPWEKVQNSNWVIFYADNRDISNYFTSSRAVTPATPLIGGTMYYDEETNTFYLGTIVGGENSSGVDVVDVHFPTDVHATGGVHACSLVLKSLVRSGRVAHYDAALTLPYENMVYGNKWQGTIEETWPYIEGNGLVDEIIENGALFCPLGTGENEE